MGISIAQLLSKNYATGNEYGRIKNQLIIQLPEYTFFMKPR